MLTVTHHDREAPATPAIDSRSRILATALRLFAARGAAATSLREVAREAGVAPGLVVHHFGGKDGLRGAVDEFVVDLFRGAVDSVPLDGPAKEVIAARDARRPGCSRTTRTRSTTCGARS